MQSSRYFMRGVAAAMAGVAAAMLTVAPAAAQTKDPKFEFAKQEEAPKVEKAEWKASAQAGLIVTTGNANARAMSAAARVSRKAGNNKLQAELGAAYADTRRFVVEDANANGVVDPGEVALGPAEVTSQSWALRGRYDRFISRNSSLYGTALLSADEPAGKELVAGGQVGYSRRLYKSERHEVVAEGGYDFSYEDPVVGDGVAIHSARVFAGYEGKLTKDTGLAGAVELLANINPLDTNTGEVAALEDTRINTTVSLTTALRSNISFRFAVSARFDNAPSLRPLPLPAADGYIILADRLDTKTEATLIINFL